MKKKLWINHVLVGLALSAPLVAAISCGDNTTYKPPANTGPKTEAELWDEHETKTMTEINANFADYYETLPDGSLRVKQYAFNDHTLGSTFKLPPNVTVIGEAAFGNTNLYQTFVLPEGVTTLEERAFGAAELFPGFNLPRSVRKIGFYAFAAINSNQGSDHTLPSTFVLPNPVLLSDAVFSGTKLFAGFGFPRKLPEFSDDMYQIRSWGGGYALSESILPDNLAWFDKDGAPVDDYERVTWGATIHAKGWIPGLGR